LVDKINFGFGSKCSGCEIDLKDYEPQYYCFFCDIYFCPKCGDTVDETKCGSASLFHPHNLVWIDVKKISIDDKKTSFVDAKKKSGMKNIDRYKLGRIKWYDNN
jgi:hypothetical protein